MVRRSSFMRFLFDPRRQCSIIKYAFYTIWLIHCLLFECIIITKDIHVLVDWHMMIDILMDQVTTEAYVKPEIRLSKIDFKTDSKQAFSPLKS